MSTNKFDVPRYIDAHMVKYKFGTQPQKFLPQSALDYITEENVVKRLIEEDEDLILNNEQLADLVDIITKKCCRLFAICVDHGESLTYLKAMIENGLDDTRLPLREQDFGSLRKHRRFVKGFLDCQKHFCTKFFAEDAIQVFDDNLSDCFSIPIDHQEKPERLKGQGAFGKVWEVSIHPNHREFLCETNQENRFAMKVVDRNEPREQDFHNEMKDVKHSHLVKCLTSFIFGYKYHMVYELANGNLEEFMEKHPIPSQVSGLTDAWLSRQLAGIAGALEVVHNPQNSGISTTKNNTLGVPQHSTTKTGYIHDIKPENILMFSYRGNKYWMRLSDFSCAKVVAFVATVSGKRDSYKTATKTGTPIYRAPESSMAGTTSRPYDMWSLGCVYIEVLVWYTEGFEALKRFRTLRQGHDRPGGLNDEGFYHEIAPASGSRPPKFALREPVNQKIGNLSQRCNEGLKDIAEVIPELLKIDPKQRIDAVRLAEKLRHLGTGTGTGISKSKSRGALFQTKPTNSSAMHGSNNRRINYPDSEFKGLRVTHHGDA